MGDSLPHALLGPIAPATSEPRGDGDFDRDDIATQGVTN